MSENCIAARGCRVTASKICGLVVLTVAGEVDADSAEVLHAGALLLRCPPASGEAERSTDQAPTVPTR